MLCGVSCVGYAYRVFNVVSPMSRIAHCVLCVASYVSYAMCDVLRVRSYVLCVGFALCVLRTVC